MAAAAGTRGAPPRASSLLLPASLLAGAGLAVLLAGQHAGARLGPGAGMVAASPAEPRADVAAGSHSRALGFAKDVASGTVAGIAVTLVGHPFDTLKVLLQTQPSDKPIYNGVKTLAAEGVGGLYKGVAAPLVGQMFFRATLFFTVARTKELFGASPENLLGYALAGSVAWGVASLAEGPIDLYKSQMQKQLIEQRQNPGLKATYASMGDAVRKSVAWNGLRGPFQGLSAVCLRNFPAAGMYFGTYETLKLKLPALTGDASPTLAHLFVAGGTAGLAYWAFFYPLDVIKSAMQTDSMDPAKRRYRSVAATAASLWAEGGVGRFYKGVAPCLIRAVPANAIMLMVNTKVRALLE